MTSQVEVVKNLAQMLGEDAVLTAPDVLDGFRRCLGPIAEGNPLAVARPKDAQEVQSIVKWANQAGINLIPSSSGPPRFRGGAIPSGDGVIVDLSRMKKVIVLDRRNKAAVIEPGVTFGELKDVVEKGGLKVLMPLLPRDTKSVLASYLEREPITIPKYHWDMTDPLLCTELVFGTGDFFRTGAAAGPGSLEDMSKAGIGLKNPMGPSATDIVRIVQGAQGTMGIVTWASVKLEVLPRERKCFFAPHARLERLIDFTYQVMRRKMADEFFLLNGTALACMLADEPRKIRELAKRQAPFSAVYCLAGYNFLPDKRVAYLEEDMAEVAQHAGVKPTREVPGCNAKRMASLIDQPCQGTYWKLRLQGGFHEIFFLTTLDKTPHYIELVERLLRANDFPREDLGIYIQPIQQGRSCHLEFHLYFDPDDADKAQKARYIVLDASKELADHKAFFSRPYGPWEDIAYARCPETVEILKELKNIFDPNGVLNRGKLCFKGV